VSEILKEPPAAAQLGDPRERWKDIPCLRLRARWLPKRYLGFPPVRLERSNSVSEQIIRDRR
jgi:hypothetical protein